MPKTKSKSSIYDATKKKKAANAYFQYRNSTIDPENKSQMRDHSRDSASGWKNQDDSQRIPFFQAAAKDAVEKEVASGGNGFTQKSFEQCGKFAFVNETPIRKEIIPPLAKQEVQKVHKRVLINNRRSDVDDHIVIKKAKVTDPIENCGIVLGNTLTTRVQQQSDVDEPSVVKKVADVQNVLCEVSQKDKNYEYFEKEATSSGGNFAFEKSIEEVRIFPLAQEEVSNDTNRVTQVQQQSDVDKPILQKILIGIPQKGKSSCSSDNFAFEKSIKEVRISPPLAQEGVSNDNNRLTQVQQQSVVDETSVIKKDVIAQNIFIQPTKSSDDDDGTMINIEGASQKNYPSDEEDDVFNKYTHAKDYIPGTDFTPDIIIDGTSLPNSTHSSFHDNCGDGLTETLNDCFNNNDDHK
ncbi:14566_t:CDS:2 [Funneliformis mosseae]|uniref:14566_t:CDS:1 n=1 Tax=Funneliformis mosseae TaxID=27381 RepID=A0A9N9AT25_FUNMO|nr:14566_t:CDS:2 [Funneliformis mosseae]